MKQTVDNSDFHQAFRNYNRQDNFSSAGLDALFEYLEEYENSTGEELELDVIALCCDYTEATLEDIKKEYDDIETIEDLQDRTQVIMVNDSDSENPLVIYQAF